MPSKPERATFQLHSYKTLFSLHKMNYEAGYVEKVPQAQLYSSGDRHRVLFKTGRSDQFTVKVLKCAPHSLAQPFKAQANYRNKS